MTDFTMPLGLLPRKCGNFITGYCKPSFRNDMTGGQNTGHCEFYGGSWRGVNRQRKIHPGFTTISEFGGCPHLERNWAKFVGLRPLPHPERVPSLLREILDPSLTMHERRSISELWNRPCYWIFFCTVIWISRFVKHEFILRKSDVSMNIFMACTMEYCQKLVIINKQVVGDLPAQNSCTFEVFFRTFDFSSFNRLIWSIDAAAASDKDSSSHQIKKKSKKCNVQIYENLCNAIGALTFRLKLNTPNHSRNL